MPKRFDAEKDESGSEYLVGQLDPIMVRLEAEPTTATFEDRAYDRECAGDEGEPLDVKRLQMAEAIIRECESPDGFCGEMPDDLRTRVEAFNSSSPTRTAIFEEADDE